MKRITKASLKALGIANPYQLTKAGGGLMLCVSYRKQELGRAPRSKAWQVWRVNHQVDPNAHWSDVGAKTFLIWPREDKDRVRDEALAWAGKKYGIKEWEKSPFGTYHPKGTIAQVVGQAAASPVNQEGE